MAREDRNSIGELPSIAEIYHVPPCRVVSIEHPCIIRNLEKGLKSLGGEPQLMHALQHKVGDSKPNPKSNNVPEPVVGVSLRPNDSFAKRLPSAGIETRNVLLKVTLPKRSGRKRKRGSDNPFEHASDSQDIIDVVTAPQLLQRLRDCENNYSLAAVSMLHETHKFRALPDFQFRNGDLALMRDVRDNVLVPEYDNLKNFKLDLTPGAGDPLAFPGPPNFAHNDLPFRYEYQQAPGVVIIADAHGNAISKNIHSHPRRVCSDLPVDIDEIPQGPPPHLRTTHPDGLLLPMVVKELEKLLAQRPLVSKRVIMANIPGASDTLFKEATQFVGYSFVSGPFRDLIIKYGVDPRKDPKYRFYQGFMFQMDKVAAAAAASSPRGQQIAASSGQSDQQQQQEQEQQEQPSYIFDGKSFTPNGKMWQICDLTEPLLYEVFHTDNIRLQCDVQHFGWFHNGTICKGRVLMRDKLRRLAAGLSSHDEGHAAIASLPDFLHRENLHLAMLSSATHERHIQKMAGTVRNMAHAYGYPATPVDEGILRREATNDREANQMAVSTPPQQASEVVATVMPELHHDTAMGDTRKDCDGDRPADGATNGYGNADGVVRTEQDRNC